MALDLRDEAAAAPAAAASPATSRRARRRRKPATGLPFGRVARANLGVIVLWLSLLVLLPLAAVVGHAFDGGWGSFWSSVTDPRAKSALELTIVISVIVAIVNAVFGTLIAWVLVRERFRGSGLLEFVIDIPFALPTIVAGLVMFALYGGNDPLGPTLFGTRAGLIVTLLFVTLPFTVRTVQPVLVDLDRDAEQAAASLGAPTRTVFRRIVLPQIVPAMASGAALSFARALGEYGSLVFISSRIPFKTEVASMIVYGKLQNADHPEIATQQASAIATVLLVASVLVLVFLDRIQRRISRHG